MDKLPKYISKEVQEEFEQFLLDNMDAAEKLVFSSKLVADQVLADQFKEFKSLFQAIEEDTLRDQLKDFHANIDQTALIKKRISKPKTNYYRMAAAITLLISLGGLLYVNQQKPNERLFNTYFTPDAGLPTTMGKNDSYAFSRAMVDYKYGKYKAAIQMWEAQLVQKPENDTLNYYLGVAHLANGNEKDAISFLETALKQEQSVFKDKAFYYLGMAHLKGTHLDLAKKAFRSSTLENAKIIAEELSEK